MLEGCHREYLKKDLRSSHYTQLRTFKAGGPIVSLVFKLEGAIRQAKHLKRRLCPVRLKEASVSSISLHPLTSILLLVTNSGPVWVQLLQEGILRDDKRLNAVGDQTRREGGEGRPLLVPLASGPQGLGQAFRGRVSVELGPIGTLVFHPGVVGVLQISCWADPCDGAVKAIFPIDDPIGWLVRGLTTVDCLCAIGPGLAENYRGFVFSGVEAGHIAMEPSKPSSPLMIPLVGLSGG